MNVAAIDLAPLIPWPLLAALAVLAAAVVALGLIQRARGSLLRAGVLGLLLLALAGPVITREEREPLADVALVVVDRSPSQSIGDRQAQVDLALAQLRETARDRADLDLHEVAVDGDGLGGTRLFSSLRQALTEVDRERLAGVLMLTDGQVHDVPERLDGLDLGAPLHLLLTGRPDETDRQLIVERVPSYGMVGETQRLDLRVEELPEGSSTAPVPVTVRQDGEVIERLTVEPGTTHGVEFEIGRAGQTVIEVEAAVREDELTALNNRSVHFVNGVRDRLRVLLVSGQPYPGLRVWRNILKADPMVDLVHFTILRPPEKQDGTPIRELALIAFPSRELFEVKLQEFDLVIFDRYSRRGLLPLIYLDNVAHYVEEGGALLEAAGPEFAQVLSLYRTPLARVLPGRPSGRIYERGFRPELTELGLRHPVTAGLVEEGEDNGWGRWFRQVDVEADGAQVLMQGVSDRPLLLLDRVGEGRVAQLLSDHAWLWARGFEDGGPQSTMLRRLVHWLMKEPELEEEALRAEARSGGIEVVRQSLDAETREITLTAPSGAVTTAELEPAGDGISRVLVEADEPGLYRIGDGELTAYAALRPMSPRELSDMRATAEVVGPLAEASGGAVRWLGRGGLPDLRQVAPGRSTAGRGWIGLYANQRHLVVGSQQVPLLPALLALALLLGAIGLAWWREGRG
jgi:hypothetical protein